MKHKTVPQLILVSSLLLITSLAVAGQVTDNKPKPPMEKGLPDLAFGLFKKLPNGDIEIAIVNKGLTKSAATEGSWTCEVPPSKPTDPKFSPKVGFPIKELAPGAQFKAKFSCGSARVLGAALDIKNKVKESDKSNNSAKF